MDPSEEDRLKEMREENFEVVKEDLTIPKKFSKLFESLDQDAIDTGLYHGALKDIFNPPSAPDLNEQVILEGLRRSPEVAPKHVVLLAEAIPSWLPVINGWGAD